MQIVIDIPDGLYHKVRETNDSLDHDEFDYIFEQIEKYGTPLPKGHGRLIDANKVKEAYFLVIGDFIKVLDSVPTILEADTESEDKEVER